MGKLQVLSAQVANMIAAGEVVQRPASVVKELVENAVDAGAGKISVVLSDAGRTLIQVIDNGSGMSPADAVLCFERHATSKIAVQEDLEAIGTFGFRGEALASISAVAEVTLKTRREQDETATQVVVGDFGNVKTSSVTAPVGSNFAVRNLFYNTPARRKFLKSDAVELKHCIEEFTRVAVTRPDLEFSLSHNGRDIFVLRKAKSLKFRILDLLGSSVVGDVVDLTAETSLVKITGFIGRPESARKTLGNQFFFVNGRYFRSAYLHKAVMNAYESLIPDGVTPSYFIFIETDPRSIDVNIHPTKTEIKFEDESLVFQILYAAVKETLGRNSFGASIDFDTDGAVEMPQLGRSFEEYRGAPVAPSPEFDTDYDPFNPDASSSPVQTEPFWKGSDYVAKQQNYGALFEQTALPASQTIIVGNRFILTRSASGVMLVSISRARERISYEKYLRALSENEHVTQTTMFPVQMQVGAASVLLVESNAELLSELGYDISSFGTDTIVVRGVPEGCSCETGKVEALVREVLGILDECHTLLPELMRTKLAEGLARSEAAGAAPLTNPVEARHLIDTLFTCEMTDRTASGAPILSIITEGELENKLK